MTQINKSAALSQLQLDISNLTAGAEDTEELLLFLKTALNAGVSAENIVTELESRIGSITTSDTVFDLVHLTKSLELITKDRTISVADVSDLAAINNLGAGSIVFVESESEPYILLSTGEWEPLFPTNFIGGTNAWAWGSNSSVNSGRLGDNTVINRSSPVSVVGNLTDWVQVKSGGYHNLGLRANGSLWAWGGNSFGELGTGDTVSRSSPVSVIGGFTDWVDISASYHSLGIRANGSLWAWGDNSDGRLGINQAPSVNRSSPTLVVGEFTDWTSAVAGVFHSLGIRANGTLWGWGRNSGTVGYAGVVGVNDIVDRSSPTLVVGGFTDWVQASGGRQHSVAIRANGTMWAWGRGSFGNLGTNNIISRSSPVSVVGGFTDWVQVSANNTHSHAIRANGTLWAWGNNLNGRLGTNEVTTLNRSSPVIVVGGFTDWVSTSGRSNNVLALRSNGTLWSWGLNSNGQLGTNETVNRSSPVSVIGGFSDWVQISSGYNSSAAIRGDN
jgi:alpha-tubulin suppressor-like RCC1 family protein